MTEYKLFVTTVFRLYSTKDRMTVPPMKLLIRDLNRSTTENELRELFESYGRVQSCTLVMDAKTGASKGFGFVEMPKPGEAKAAMKNLNGKLVGEHKIRVKKAEDKPKATS